MTPSHAQHADLFRTVAEILVRDYQAPSETAETVQERLNRIVEPIIGNKERDWFYNAFVELEPSDLAELIACTEGYEMMPTVSSCPKHEAQLQFQIEESIRKSGDHQFRVKCQICSKLGPARATLYGAIKAWNAALIADVEGYERRQG